MTYYIAEIRLNVKRKSGKTKNKTAKKLSKPLIALIFALMLSSTLIMVVPATSNSEEKIKECLNALSEDVKSELPKEAFENTRCAEGQRKALANKIAAVTNQIEAGAYNGAVNKLKNDVSSSVTNWIADQEWETILLEKVEEIINLIEGLSHPNMFPVAVFTDSAGAVVTGETISFNASGSYDPDGFIVGYYWSFGDGASGVGVVVDHAYSDDGAYEVTLTVTDDEGATTTFSSNKTVFNRLPVAMFTESAEAVSTGEPVSFNASGSYDPDGFIVGYYWSFGDGASGVGVVVDHAYSEVGNYTVTLTVMDNDGATAMSSKTETVEAPTSLSAELLTTILLIIAVAGAFLAYGFYRRRGTATMR